MSRRADTVGFVLAPVVVVGISVRLARRKAAHERGRAPARENHVDAVVYLLRALVVFV